MNQHTGRERGGLRVDNGAHVERSGVRDGGSPAVSHALGHGVVIPGVDPPSAIVGGEAFLARIYNAYQQMQSPAAGSNVWNTALLIGWDEPGGTYDHVPPGPVPPPDPSARTFSHAFTLDIPRDPSTWPVLHPYLLPGYIQDAPGLGKVLSTLGKAVFNGIRACAEQHNIKIEGLPADPKAEIPPSRQCSSSVTSSRSNSPYCIGPLRVPAPQSDPDVRQP